MLYFTRNSCGAKPQVGQTAAAAVLQAIDSSPDYYAGEVESLRSKLRKQSEVIAAIIDSLPDEAQREIVALTTYDWKEVE